MVSADLHFIPIFIPSRFYGMLGLKNLYNSFIRWLVGKEIFERRISELSNRFAISLNVLAGVISLLYLITDVLIGEIVLITAHILLLLGFISGTYLFRIDRIELAKSVVLLIYNVALFMIVAAEPIETGSSLYFLMVMIGAIVVFEYEKFKYSIFFILLPFVSYIIAHKTSLTILPSLGYSEQTIDIFFFINISIFTVATSLILILYIQMIYLQKKKIIDQNERLKQTNHELDYFLYSTSHDLRAPLATVLGLLNLAEATEKKEELESYHNMMRSRIDKMDTFIKDIIDVIRNSRMPVSVESVHLKILVNGIISELDNPMGLKTVEWRIDIPEEEEIFTDQKRLATIMKNLISNAVKYSDPKKDPSFVSVEGQKNGEWYSLKVRDNGIGIARDHLEKIFEMFYRATESSKGAGLGLYIAGETTRTLGGKIFVDSEEGKGATFELKLPLN